MAQKPKSKRDEMLVYALLLIAAFSFRVALARLLPNDEPFESQVYVQIARNALQQGVYSHATEPPFEPTLIRLPGYPLFLAGVYSVFGVEDHMGVRIVQALADTLSCGLIALMAFLWEPDPKRKRRTSIAALALAAFCPFTAIYVSTILPETLTIFFSLAMCLTATLAFKASTQMSAALLWSATGVLAGTAVLFRPDSGIFAAAIGITLVITKMLRVSDASFDKKKDEMLNRFARVAHLVAMFSLAFCLVLVPWTIRNFRVFHLFQPLAPAHAAMPGEFVPHGYFSWLRTWVDDSRYIGPVIWALDELPIKLDDIPARAFDSAEERQRVAILLEEYNHPPEGREQTPADDGSQQEPALPLPEDQPEPNEGSEPPKTDDGRTVAEEGDELKPGTDDLSGAVPGDELTDQSADQSPAQPVQMTPEIDAGFAMIAEERVRRNPLRHYLLLPGWRAVSLWFDTHSQYYPFEGDLIPLKGEYSAPQQFWLRLFAGFTFFYTLLGIWGGVLLWRSREFVARQWLLLAGLLIFLRIAYFATFESPEPRNVVEVFPFLSILGGIALTRILTELQPKAVRRK